MQSHYEWLGNVGLILALNTGKLTGLLEQAASFKQGFRNQGDIWVSVYLHLTVFFSNFQNSGEREGFYLTSPLRPQ